MTTSADEPELDGSSLWETDTGTLRADSRRAFVQLLRGPYLSAARHGHLWAALLNDEAEVRSQLADAYLELVVDAESQLAFARNVSSPDADAPKVSRGRAGVLCGS
jgi:hypothetical protein